MVLTQSCFATPTVVFVQPLTLASLNVFRHRLHGQGGLLRRYGIEHPLVVVINALQLGSVMTAAADREDTDEQPRVVNNSLNPRIVRHAHQQSMEAQIAFDETVVQLAV